MSVIYVTIAGWLLLAVVSAVLARHLRTSAALLEICVGALAAWVIDSQFGPGTMGGHEPGLQLLASIGAVLLTFLAGAELDPRTMRTKFREVTVVGLVGFLGPFVGCAFVCRYWLGWDLRASLLGGIALSTTSMAVVYAVMLETGFNRTGFGKGVLGSCFVNDLGTVIALGLLFAPFSWRTAVFAAGTAGVLSLMPWATSRLTGLYGHRTAAIRSKWIILVLTGLGGLAFWAGTEAVLPAYLVGMVLAGSAGRDEAFIRRFRTLTIGFLAPFYFLRAGSLVSLPALAVAPLALLALLAGKVASKILGLYPVIGVFWRRRNERWYYTLMMSTGLTFGTISSLYGLSHGIVTRTQYSLLVAAVIGSAVIPTLIAGYVFFPRHLLPGRGRP
jgi:glutathione-regulated potassium-efflux system ancillary protein KefC